jgi:gliding motility-associated-like protein
MKLIFSMALVLQFVIGRGFSQNLVPNSGFESFSQLPCNQNSGRLEKFLLDWNQPIATSTDYWNDLTAPTCYFNPQTSNVRPRSGHGTVGIVSALVLRGERKEYKEYMQIKLIRPLVKGHLYYGEFYAKNGDILAENDYLSANNLAISLSSTQIVDQADSKDHLSINAMISETEIIKPEGSWRKISGCFRADSSYSYLLIGNFKSVRNTDIEGPISAQSESIAYYLIDDVSLIELPYDLTTLATTAQLCYSQSSIALDVTVAGASSYSWSGGNISSGMLFVTTKRDSMYSVKINFNECVYKHVIDVKFIPEIELGSDTTLCREETFRLTATFPLSDYMWWDGSGDSTKTISTDGLYSIEGGLGSSCPSRDTVAINFVDCPGTIPNVFTPNGDQFNESFEIENIEIRNWTLTVYNRWGEAVYFAETYHSQWDGHGSPDGIYFYLLSCQALNKKIKGWVKILR